jgi:glyoxylase-like metal-dependent hydrolase (beta-lactamase superfamily II)
MPIVYEERNITEFVSLIDLMQFGQKHLATGFLVSDGKKSYLLDVGTSDNVRQVLRSIKKRGCDLTGLIGIFPTHYHFDHAGGCAKLHKKMQEYNPNFKIFTTELTKKKLQNSQAHLEGAKTTFNEWVGTMEYIEDSAFNIIDTNKKIPLEIEGVEIELISTPGHSPDHVAIAIYEHGKLAFIFCGEAGGTLFHSEKITSLPTSMPPNFNHELYMKGLHELIEKDPPNIGFCHFGAIQGREDARIYWKTHLEFMNFFRETVKKTFEEKQSTRAVVERMIPEFTQRTNTIVYSAHQILINLVVALCYGMLVDLKFKEPKYERN